MIRKASSVVLAFLACVVALISVRAMRANVIPVVLTGQPAPGTANARFSGIVGRTSVNASGDMTFLTLLDVGGVPSAGIFAIRQGVIAPVALEGQALPDRSNLFFGGGLSFPFINNNGDIVFVSNFAADAAGTNFGNGLFLFSSGVLRTVLDSNSLGLAGARFGPPQLNDNGDMVVIASGGVGASSGLYRISKGVITLLTSQTTFVGNYAVINNPGQIVFRNPDAGLSEYSNGVITPIVGPGYGLATGHQADAPSINDAGDIVFVDYVLQAQGRGGALLPVANAVRRWRQGTLTTIAAAGDPVPGVSGATLWNDFEFPQVNDAAIVFQTSTAPVPGQSPVSLICRYEHDVLRVIARADEPIVGINATLNRIGLSGFDNKQGALMTLLANPGVLDATTGPQGIYAATAGQFPLLFPQIADGISAGGAWRTTVILANQPQGTNSALTTPPTAAATARISFFDDTGAPMTVSVGGQLQSDVTITVPALGVASFQTDGVDSLRTGWARVQADQTLSGIALFGFTDAAGSFEVGDAAAVPLRSLSVFVQSGTGTATGIALANPNAATASVTLTLKDANANTLSTISMSVPPMGHLARYAPELFGSLPPGDFQGKMEVLSTVPVIAITLRQRGSVFTSLPIIP